MPTWYRPEPSRSHPVGPWFAPPRLLFASGDATCTTDDRRLSSSLGFHGDLFVVFFSFPAPGMRRKALSIDTRVDLSAELEGDCVLSSTIRGVNDFPHPPVRPCKGFQLSIRGMTTSTEQSDA